MSSLTDQQSTDPAGNFAHDTAKFLVDVCNKQPGRFRLIQEMIRALSKAKQFEVLTLYGQQMLPFKANDNIAEGYGHMFEMWCEAVYKAFDRPKAKSIVKEIVDKDHEVNGQQVWNTMYRASVEFDKNAPDQVLELFRYISGHNEKHITSNVHGASSVRPVGHFGSMDMNANPLGLKPFEPTAAMRSTQAPQLVHLVACDWNYWNIFHEELLGSLIGIKADFLTHVHIINAEKSADELQAYVSQRFPSVKVNVSTEGFAIPENWKSQWNGMNLRAFYTFLRFMRAPDIANFYNRPVLITEFDAQLGDRMANVIPETEGMDVGLCFYDDKGPNFFPWNSVWAGTVFFRPNPGGRNFMRHVTQYCFQVYAQGVAENKPMWHVDQNALFLAYCFFSENYPNVNISEYPFSARPVTKNFGNIASMKAKA